MQQQQKDTVYFMVSGLDSILYVTAQSPVSLSQVPFHTNVLIIVTRC